MSPNRKKYLATAAVLCLALGAVLLKYRHYLANPWTRDGQVRAVVITVAPRVTGPIVSLPIVDNQFVKVGDPLFEIDPRTFLSALQAAKANLDLTLQNLQVLDNEVVAASQALRQSEARIAQAEADIAGMKSQYHLAKKNYGRAEALVDEAVIAVSEYDQKKENRDMTHSQLGEAQSALAQAQAAKLQAEADLAKAVAARGPAGEDNPQLRAAQAALEDARLNYEFTRQTASVDGYVTNLNLRLGSQAVANAPALALVDASSFWVAAYFMETQTASIRSGQSAVVTFMSYPDTPVPGVVESVGWGIFQEDGSVGQNLLPAVSPTFEWIRLAQRIPVRIHVEPKDDRIKLRVGMTASVLVMTAEGARESAPNTPPLPAALQ